MPHCDCCEKSDSCPATPPLDMCTELLQAGAGGGKYVMRDLMRVLEQEKHAYTDPVTEVRIDINGRAHALSRMCCLPSCHEARTFSHRGIVSEVLPPYQVALQLLFALCPLHEVRGYFIVFGISDMKLCTELGTLKYNVPSSLPLPPLSRGGLDNLSPRKDFQKLVMRRGIRCRL